MKKIKILFLLLLFGSAALLAAAQTSSLSLSGITGSGNTWHYGTVTCTSPNNITSITLSMINNNIASFGNRTGAGITPSQIFYSLGNNPRTVTYLFSTPITAARVQDFIGGIDFTRDDTAVSGINPYVRILVDANPTHLPAGASITVWEDHPDGVPHYYMYVSSPSIKWDEAYNAAKTYYFQGMRGYLTTITSHGENQTLLNISTEEAWSGGVMLTGETDGIMWNNIINLRNNWIWGCGPEKDVVYFTARTFAGGGREVGYHSWSRLVNEGPGFQEPNGGALEPCMQVNYSDPSSPGLRRWNDYAHDQMNIKGYFIEFGGSGEAYTVNDVTYPANNAYKKPTTASGVTPQWHNYSPGNTSVAGSTLKPTTGMRSNVMVIE